MQPKQISAPRHGADLQATLLQRDLITDTTDQRQQSLIQENDNSHRRKGAATTVTDTREQRQQSPTQGSRDNSHRHNGPATTVTDTRKR